MRSLTSIVVCTLLLINSFLSAQPAGVENLEFHPITYVDGPDFPEGRHAYIKLTIPPSSDIQYFNLRLINPVDGTTVWAIKNLPILPFDAAQTLCYRINTEWLDGPYSALIGEYILGEWSINGDFFTTAFTTLAPRQSKYRVGSGSADSSLDLPADFPLIAVPPGIPPNIPVFHYRGCKVPNIDLDSMRNYPDFNPLINDYNACGPAAAANSLIWLLENDPRLEDHNFYLVRELADSLKKYMAMAKRDSNGVRFDSMVVGKLTLIDKLQLPIRVKYNTLHDSGYPDSPLASEVPEFQHIAENQGKKGEHPDFSWYKKEMEAGEDVEVQVGWYGPPDADGKRMRHGGHWLVGTGYFDSGNKKGLYLKHDTRQDTVGGTVHEYFDWDTLSNGWPYLINLTDLEGRVGVVESFVSESYDPGIVYDYPLEEFEFSMGKIEYSDISMLDDEYHVWLKFKPPLVDHFQFINARVCHPDTSKEGWVIQNVPIPPFFNDPIRTKIDLRAIACGDTLPSKVIIKFQVGELLGADTLRPTQMVMLMLVKEIVSLPSGILDTVVRLFPKPDLNEPNIQSGLSATSHLRGCEVPNIDLDSLAYPVNPDNLSTGDINACGPAAMANSLAWLDDQHSEFDIPLNLRSILDTLKKMSNFEGQGTFWDMMVDGKLTFIDTYQLPLHVKYQAYPESPAFVDSPIPRYGHRAENTADKINDTTYQYPSFGWMCQELERGEDVELVYGVYCDTIIQVVDSIREVTLPDGTVQFDTTFRDSIFEVNTSAHVINVTGKMTVGDLKWITYKHDVFQSGPGGTIQTNTPDSLRFTDLSEWIETNNGRAVLTNEVNPQDASFCRAYVENIISCSYDPTIEFCIEDAYLPLDDGEGSLRHAIECAKNGDTIRLSSILAGDTIKLSSGSLIIDKNLTILADPTDMITISGADQSRIFDIQSGAKVTLSGIHFICGNDLDVRCIRNEGELILNDISFLNASGAPTGGTMIENKGTLIIEGNTSIRK